MIYDISVVIPTYNAELYITDALTSILNQTFQGSIEVLIIDDCSSDATLEKVDYFISQHPNLNVLVLKQEKNMRQGTARNRGIGEARGKYVFFLDADDFIDPNTFDKLFAKAELHSCDFVLCDWAYYYKDKGLVYVNNDDFLFDDILLGEEVESLLKANTYFSVNKLYNRDFLVDNHIRFGEGYIYEDFEFYIQVAQLANNVGVVQNPYYRVRVNEHSTTKTNTKTKLHVESLLKSINSTVAVFLPRDEYSYYHVYKYLIRKTLYYLDHRAPRGYKRNTLKRILHILNNKRTKYPVPKKVVPLYHFLFRRKYIQNSRVSLILLVWWLHSVGKLNPIFSFVLKIKWKILDSKIALKVRKKARIKKIQSFYKKPIKKNMVLFMGFDYRYAGNSKYFFDYLITNERLDVFFVTKDQNVPSDYRIPPRSLKFYKKLAQSKIVIFESWMPLAFKKREGSIWIQLWHGTPFKKLFFDSHEYYISSFNKNHKKKKQEDIRRWDYLLADSKGGADKLSSAFAFDKQDILTLGYPRVQWLKDNIKNNTLKHQIKNDLMLTDKQKIILYTPTWRDYNYKSSNPDLDYLIDMDKLVEYLPNDYVILYKEHSMGKYQRYNNRVIIPSNDIELQHLILISDIIVSDFSSIIFDAMSVDIPFYLFINDFEKYANARGVYDDLNELLKPFYVHSEEELSNKIINDYLDASYREVKNTFAQHTNKSNSNFLLEKFLLESVEDE
ncbi:bifunctional glycosyltransferase/CDP-glycerol:glycerophosphate glycerophosphotransferase [Lentibacillus saliphilus]|uniref:bifunctional glycosyltransferase/CDP-glycerol:glycerophosphate glycerophosphotransferase n=1 Tax=Lentibacillus saliphilus TaxID=2737028 RepID=UPI001C2FDF94|nr:CDP-glycerol glycerophosphotransferase family protein [Lentibacillus saliphilus]